MEIEGVEALAEVFREFWSKEEDNETVKWREVFKGFEESRTLREAQATRDHGR